MPPKSQAKAAQGKAKKAATKKGAGAGAAAPAPRWKARDVVWVIGRKDEALNRPWPATVAVRALPPPP